MTIKLDKPKLSVCIVSYNTEGLLRRCLRSLFRFTRNISFEIIVVDNGSSDNSAEMVHKEFPAVKLITNSQNNWYAQANNQALGVARGKYILFLNPDTYVTGDALSQMVQWMDGHPRAIAMEPVQIGDDGKFAPTGSLLNQPLTDAIELTFLRHVFGNSPLIAAFRQRTYERQETFQTEVISGAALVVRTSDVRKIGGFCERLKLYYTDTDLCRKLLARGEIWHVGEIQIHHSLSQSTKTLSWWMGSGIWADDAFRYYWMTGRKVSAVALWLLLQKNKMLVQGKIILKGR